MTLEAIREVANEVWVLGNDRSKARMAKKLTRPAAISSERSGEQRLMHSSEALLIEGV